MANVLLLEPDRWLAGRVSAFLRAAGHSVSTFAGPQAAVTAADKQRPAVVVAELQLAGRSGVEFLYEFGSYADWQNIPIIIFTNLQPPQVGAYREVLTQLNIRTYLYKTRTSLDALLVQIEAALRPAKV